MFEALADIFRDWVFDIYLNRQYLIQYYINMVHVLHVTCYSGKNDTFTSQRLVFIYYNSLNLHFKLVHITILC